MRLIALLLIAGFTLLVNANQSNQLTLEKQKFNRVSFEELYRFEQSSYKLVSSLPNIDDRNALNHLFSAFDYQLVGSKNLPKLIPVKRSAPWAHFYLQTKLKEACVVSLPVAIDTAINNIAFRLFQKNCQAMAVARLHPDSTDRAMAFYAPWKHPQTYFHSFLKAYGEAKPQAKHIQIFTLAHFIKPPEVNEMKVMLSHSMPLVPEELKTSQSCLSKALGIKVHVFKNDPSYFEDLQVVQRETVKDIAQFIRIGFSAEYAQSIAKNDAVIAAISKCVL
jgi:hypothetical protein